LREAKRLLRNQITMVQADALDRLLGHGVRVETQRRQSNP
jgi:hypothetical protein